MAISSHHPAAPPHPILDPPVDQAMDIVSRIGQTPLLKSRVLAAKNPQVTLYIKAEWFNPGGSVKDRAARQMILEGESTGQLRPGQTILDASSGNTGIAYAMIGAARGYAVEICLPANASAERKRLLKIYGATVIETDPLSGTDGAILEAKRRYAERPDAYFYADQYGNDANWQAHYQTTAPEIWQQSGGQITHFVAGLGTSGTMMGNGRRLREYNPDIQLIAVGPDSPYHGLEGLKHMETAIVPGIYDPSVPTQFREASTEDAYRMAKRAAREEGWLLGVSGAAILNAALGLCQEIEKGVVVALMPDGGNRYLSDRFWDFPE